MLCGSIISAACPKEHFIVRPNTFLILGVLGSGIAFITLQPDSNLRVTPPLPSIFLNKICSAACT